MPFGFARNRTIIAGGPDNVLRDLARHWNDGRRWPAGSWMDSPPPTMKPSSRWRMKC